MNEESVYLPDLQGNFFLNPEDPGPVRAWMSHHRNWEPHVTKDLVPYLTPGSLFVDGGAHLGFYSCLALVHGCYTVTVEPDPFNGLFLIKNLRLYSKTGEESLVFPGLLWDSDGIGPLYHSRVNFGDHTAYPEFDKDRVTWVETRTLKSLVQDQKVDVIKLDTQGSESKILKGGEEILVRDQPVLFFEYYPRGLQALGDHPGDLLEFLWDLGYELWDQMTNSRLTTIPDQKNVLYCDIKGLPRGRENA